MRLEKCYVADFETTTDEEDCRVWAYALCNIEDTNKFIYGNNLDDFFKFCSANSRHNYKIWFHNLRFDGIFLLDYLMKNNFTLILDKKEKHSKTFTTLISDMGQFYSITVYFTVNGRNINKVEFFDSLKIFPNFSVERMAEAFDLPISKLKIDYNAKREVGHELTTEEVNYIRNDVEIVARALKEMFKRGLTKMTIASDAMNYFKDTFVGFRRKFPLLPDNIDADIRKSYRGGFTYVNPVWQGREAGRGVTLDVNSLYPFCMHSPNVLPYGEPQRFDGEYQYDENYPLYVQNLLCSFNVKEGKIPSIQLKGNRFFVNNEYVHTTNGKVVELTLTTPDYELFKEQYNMDNVTFVGGWKFKAATGLFDNYINYWTAQKIKAHKEGNKPLRAISKLLQNSLYGRFGISSIADSKVPYLKDDGTVGFRIIRGEKPRETCYLPVAAFTTALGRKRTIETSQTIRDYTLAKYGEDRYFYSDTDSCHANLSDEDLEELKDIINIDDTKLGYWKKEAVFSRSLFLRQKAYIELVNNKLNVTVAGLPKYLGCLVNFENFKKGFTTEGMTLDDMIKLAKSNGATDEEIETIHHKLTYKYVNGGVILKDTGFTIK